MRTTHRNATGVLIAGLSFALSGCGSGPVRADQLVGIDNKTVLAVEITGVDAKPTSSNTIETPAAGEPIHRVLLGPDGKVLFAYDLTVQKGASGGWDFRLLPSQQKPTFEKVREVSAASKSDTVSVELLENPQTGRKAVDVFRLIPRQQPMSLRAVHDHIFHVLHGD